MPTAVERLLDDVDIGLQQLDKLDNLNDLETTVKVASRIIASAKVAGLDKKDGQTLVDLGVVEQSFVDALEDVRSMANANQLGMEASIGGLAAAAIIGVIGLFTALLSFIIKKLFDVFGEHAKEGPVTAEVAKKEVGKVRLSKEEIDALVDPIWATVESLTPSLILGNDASKKFRYLSYSYERAMNYEWVTKCLDSIEEVHTKLADDLPKEIADGSLNALGIEKLRDELLTTNRDYLDSYVTLSTFVMSDFLIPEKSTNNDGLSSQLIQIKSFMHSGLKRYIYKGLENISLAEFKQVGKSTMEDSEAAAKKLLKATNKLKDELTDIKAPDRKSSSMLASYLRHHSEFVLRNNITLLKQVIIPYLSDRIKFEARFNGHNRKFFRFCGGIIRATEDADASVDMMERVRRVGEMDEPPKETKKYARAFKPAPKDLREFTTRVLEIDIAGK